MRCKNRKAFSILLTFALIVSLFAGFGFFQQADAANTLLSPQTVYVDGTQTNFEVYNIDGNNYFKLRDIAYVLDQTDSQFGVGWDATSGTVSITTDSPYIANGSELDTSRGDQSPTATISVQTIKIDGKVEKGLSVYNIGGNNFFKLRELGSILSFTVDYDSTKNSVIIESGSTSEHNIGGNLRVHYIDCGQGDSIFIELPSGQSILIDAGDTGHGNDVVNYIRNLGYMAIDFVVATHPHSDHIGGMPEVFDAFVIRNIYVPKVSTTTQVFENFLDAVDNEGIGLTEATAGAKLVDYGNMDVTILSPTAGSNYKDLNDWSVILLVTYGDKDFLFTGDAGSSVIHNAIDSDIEVLKVSHHGSYTGTSQELLEDLSPEYAVISVGEGNSYGHPHDSVLDLLASVKTYRTDNDGTVIATSNGTSINFTTKGRTPSPDDDDQPGNIDKPSEDDNNNIGNQIVYVTKTGGKYHSDGCSYLSKSKIAMTLDEAIAKGYTPCSRCNPPRK